MNDLYACLQSTALSCTVALLGGGQQQQAHVQHLRTDGTMAAGTTAAALTLPEYLQLVHRYRGGYSMRGANELIPSVIRPPVL